VEDEARERLAGAIRRDLVPHLAGVEHALGGDRPPGATELAGLIDETEVALEQLRLVCRGVFPALLKRRGLVPALTAQLDTVRSQAAVEVDDSADRRLDRAAEAAGYLFCVEVAPVDRSCVIALAVHDGRLTATVTGDAEWAKEVAAHDDPGMVLAGARSPGGGSELAGSDDGGPAAGTISRNAVPRGPGGWQHVRDRVAALDGEISGRCTADGGLAVTAVIPLGAQPDRDLLMAPQTSSSRSGPNIDFGT